MTEYTQMCKNCIGPRAVALADAERYDRAARRALYSGKESTEKWEREKVAGIYQAKADAARRRADIGGPLAPCVLCGATGTVIGNGSAELGGGSNARTPMAGERVG